MGGIMETFGFSTLPVEVKPLAPLNPYAKYNEKPAYVEESHLPRLLWMLGIFFGFLLILIIIFVIIVKISGS